MRNLLEGFLMAQCCLYSALSCELAIASVASGKNHGHIGKFLNVSRVIREDNSCITSKIQVQRESMECAVWFFTVSIIFRLPTVSIYWRQYLDVIDSFCIQNAMEFSGKKTNLYWDDGTVLRDEPNLVFQHQNEMFMW